MKLCLVVLRWSLHQKNMSSPPLLGAILGCFWAHVDICSSISWKPFNIFSWNFVGITLMVTTLTKKIIKKISDHVLCCQAILACFSLSWEPFNIFPWKCVQMFLVLLWWSIHFFWHHDHFCWGPFFGIFGPIFSCFSISRELCNILSWHCVQMCLVVLWWSLHKKNVLFPSADWHFGVFWGPCQQCSSVSWEHSIFHHELL